VIVADGALRWTGGAAPAIVLLPSTVASLWGGHHLWGFQREIARSLAGVSALDGVRGPAWRPLAVLAGAVGRFATGTAVLSGALVLARPALGLARVDVTLLAAFALLALATLLVSLLEAVGRGAWALGAVAAALGAETLAASSGGGGAGPLLAGGAAAVAVALPAAVALLMRPANTLATTLYVR
jgi:hypothetical protein